jgi:plasmid stability protein
MVGFRLPDALRDKLRVEAEAKGLTPGTYARELLTQVLQDEERLVVLERLEATREEVARLRRDVATTLEVLLLNVAKFSPDQVREFVRRNLRDM